MNKDNWHNLKQIFTEAIGLPPEKRLEFVEKACGDDAELRRDVEALIGSYHEEYLEKPAIADLADVIGDDLPAIVEGDFIGDYCIIRELGSGGQGRVFLAEDLSLKRRVAVKLLSSSAGSEADAIKRFRREAQAAATISHPNICSIHNIGQFLGREYIVMQYADGATLSAMTKERRLSLTEISDIAIQIADGLTVAHKHGIIHRDLKPSNIIISDNGQIKILDFGLAKLVDLSIAGGNDSATNTGIVVGTPAYMSPEQATGRSVDATSDIWSFGVLLFELTTGINPFLRESMAETLAAILTEEPDFRLVPEPFTQIIRRMLRKKPDERPQQISTVLAELRELSRLSQPVVPAPAGSAASNHHTVRFIMPALAAVLLGAGLIGIAGWYIWSENRRAAARENFARIELLVAEEKPFEAFDLFIETEKILTDDPNLARFDSLVRSRFSLRTAPPGARVFLKRFQPDLVGAPAAREFIGETPIENRIIARGQYLLEIEKDGFAGIVRSFSNRLPKHLTNLVGPPPIDLTIQMHASESLPDKTVFVPGGNYRLVSFTRPTAETVMLDDFYIDKYEVSNAEYREFVTSGGYSKEEYWTDLLPRNESEFSFEVAMRSFRDRTGLPGPRSWSNQEFPEGKAGFPVTDITWIEAAAFANFRGKSLPSVFQWEKAARDGYFDEVVDTMPWGLSGRADEIGKLANFRGESTVAVDDLEFGSSPYGCLNMAGNVSEWLANNRGTNAFIAGGAFGETPYLFGYYGDFPRTHSSPKIGFRLVKNKSQAKNGGGEIRTATIPHIKPSAVRDFEIWRANYKYDAAPLDAQIIQRLETDSWVRETVTFSAAKSEKSIGYLYLPKNARRPLQVVHWIPGADVPLGLSSLTHSVEDFLSPVIKSGRAVFAVAVTGYQERPREADLALPAEGTVAFRDEMVARVVDWRRGIDYLHTRNDIDPNKIGFVGLSHGGNLGLILSAVESRYAALAFVGIGLRQDWLDWNEAANMFNFAPHIKQRKLILKGRYDEAHPLKTESEPLFGLLQEPRRIIIVESGHIPPPEILAPNLNSWFDETLGLPND